VFKHFVVFLFLSKASLALCQLPDTDIWLLDITTSNNSIALGNPINITKRLGYDNQPMFSPDCRFVLYSSIRENGQSTIYKYDLISKTTSAQAAIAEAVYSPTFLEDSQHFAVVMVEPDQRQRLWKFATYEEKPNLWLSLIDSVGYFCVINKDSLVYVKITEPPTMYLANIGKQHSNKIANNVARGFAKSNSQQIYYLDKMNDTDNFIIRCVNNKAFNSTQDLTLPAQVQDFVLFQNRYFCFGLKSELWILDMITKQKTMILDLSKHGIKQITRLAISPNNRQLAIVAE
jgi:hypothetical protein